MEALNESKKEFYTYFISASKFYYDLSNTVNSPGIVCEMLYEAINAGIKLLAYYFSLQDKSRSEIVKELSNILGDWVERYWNLGVTLHYDCYLSGNVDENDIPFYENQVKDFISKVQEVVFD
ncbi:PaREP1 family protein [Sulfolobus tengchongensis]|uniref:PaREP1 family protein n=1 Tax=Sulfolobus tengchongensis TaxID=207809 RepID=A0AAX4KXY8_9CREN